MTTMLPIKNELLYGISKLSTLGAYPFHVFIAFLFYKLDYIQESVFLFAGFMLIYALGVPLRFVLFTKREHPKNQDKFLEEWKLSSFPSLHAARISFLSSFYVQFFGLSVETVVFALVISFLVCTARVIEKKHFVSDVIGGAVLGVLSYGVLFFVLP